jgi:dephospho-CoA kinase
VVTDGAIDRAKLSAHVVGQPEALKRLETIVHPLVGESRKVFFEAALEANAPLVILDIPLLFETGGERNVAAVIVVSAPEAIQRERVMARPDMTAEKLDAILARQLPDAEKRARADIVIDTSKGLDSAREQVRAAIAKLLAS